MIRRQLGYERIFDATSAPAADCHSVLSRLSRDASQTCQSACRLYPTIPISRCRSGTAESRPLETFKYQIYDVRKGEYTPAVDAWVQLMRTKYTAYYVAIRDVDLAREHGDTDQLKVGAVVKRELMVAAALEGVVVGNGLPRPQLAGNCARTRAPRAPGMIDRRSSRGSRLCQPSLFEPAGAEPFLFRCPTPGRILERLIVHSKNRATAIRKPGR